jgi:hypothetical protein
LRIYLKEEYNDNFVTDDFHVGPSKLFQGHYPREASTVEDIACISQDMQSQSDMPDL